MGMVKLNLVVQLKPMVMTTHFDNYIWNRKCHFATRVTNELGGLSVNASTGNGDITFSGNIGASATKAGVIGTTLIGNNNNSDLNFNSTIYSFDGGDTTIKATSGDSIDLAADAQLCHTRGQHRIC